MARLRVTHSQKGRGGRITGLYGPRFGFRPTAEIVRHLSDQSHQYFVREGPWEDEVKVSPELGEGFLLTTRDVLSRNNLRNLPDF
jgi:hypothetical protein